MQAALFDMPAKPRKPRELKAHVVDAGDDGCGKSVAEFECKRCGWNSGWIIISNVTEARRGIACEVCNQPLGARVHNKHHKTAPSDAVYIGRGSPWGNPFAVGKDGTREQVIERFKCEVLPRLDLAPLVGKDLVCYCYPKPCHGDAIIEVLQQAREAE
ncbi:hypothetical protein PsAD5_00138 [Pseudovibrio sp. Ad5]|uniref:DUF4326 domain-containing protein n=1 Tax=unclassified Pseudovibrio TaxID=2627060 RepID=UPI0007B1831B|nr:MULTISPECIES: DUF4326 domain-containing protein [unclassified Pseudovibrio]KZL02189.1 hypothetical protein PsAD5_00138 [Pseudovibrio sp. Ad5]